MGFVLIVGALACVNVVFGDHGIVRNNQIQPPTAGASFKAHAMTLYSPSMQTRLLNPELVAQVPFLNAPNLRTAKLRMNSLFQDPHGRNAGSALSSTPLFAETQAPSYVVGGMAFIDKIALVLVRDRRTLVARSKGKQVYFTPGGKREPGETDAQALVREIKEELNVDITVDSIKRYGTFQAQAFGKPAGTMVRITGYTAEFTGELLPGAEVEELRWISWTEKDLTTVTGQLVLDDLKEKGLID